MKVFTIILFIAFSCFQSSLFAQQGKDKPEEKEKKELSDIQELAVSKGMLLKKEFKNVGKFGKDIEFQILTITDLIDKVTVKGLRIKYVFKTEYKAYNKSVFIDKKECKSMIESLEIIRKEILPLKTEVYTEAFYTTKEGVEIGCFLTKEAKWDAYFKIEQLGDDYFKSLEMKDLGEFKALLEAANQLME